MSDGGPQKLQLIDARRSISMVKKSGTLGNPPDVRVDFLGDKGKDDQAVSTPRKEGEGMARHSSCGFCRSPTVLVRGVSAMLTHSCAPFPLGPTPLQFQITLACIQCVFVVGSVYLKSSVRLLDETKGEDFSPIVFAFVREASAGPLLFMAAVASRGELPLQKALHCGDGHHAWHCANPPFACMVHRIARRTPIVPVTVIDNRCVSSCRRDIAETARHGVRGLPRRVPVL